MPRERGKSLSRLLLKNSGSQKSQTSSTRSRSPMNHTPSAVAAAAAKKTARKMQSTDTQENMGPNISTSPQQVSQTVAQIHSLGEEDIITNTPIPQKVAAQSKVSFRELQNLQSTNVPGTLELSSDIPSRRNHRPSYQKARFIYDEALKKLKTELEEFDAQSYHNLSPEVRAQSDIRLRYRSIRIRDHSQLPHKTLPLY